MTQEQRNNLGQILGAMGIMYGRNDLTPPVLSMYLDDLEHAGLSYDQAVQAVTRYRRESKNTRFPLPSQLIETIRPTTDPKTIANELARKIDQALTSHGHRWHQGYFHDYDENRQPICRFEANTPEGKKVFWSFKEAVIAELGAIGWHAICSRGGWDSLSQSQREMPEGMFIAQLRDQVESSVTLSRQGVDVTRIGMPTPRNPSGELEHVGKLLDFKRPEDTP